MGAAGCDGEHFDFTPGDEQGPPRLPREVHDGLGGVVFGGQVVVGGVLVGSEQPTAQTA